MSVIKFTGGLRWGNAFWGDTVNVTYPFASLQIESDKCILTRHFFWVHYVSYEIRYEQIEYVSLKKFLFSKGVLFTHTNKNIPKYLLFWTKKTDQIFDILAKHGIKVL